MDDDQREQLLNLSHRLDESADKLSSKKGETMSRKYYEVDLRTLREAIDKEKETNEYMEENEAAMEEMGAYDEGKTDTELEELYEEFSFLLEQDEEEADDAGGEDVESDLPALDDLPPLDDAPAGGGDMISKADLEGALAELAQEFDLDLSDDLGFGGAEGGDMPPMEDMGAMMGDEGEDAEQLDEVFNVDPRILRQEINRIKRLVREGKMDHHFGGKGGGNAGVDGAYGGKGKQNAGVNGAYGGGTGNDDPFEKPPALNRLNEAIRQLRRQNRAQSEKLNKYRGAVNSLREQLEDLNLFNAKLLYVNKLLQNKSLNESQKKSVIKALDEAQSLQEAKSLYSSLTETFRRSESKGTLSESRILGSSSRPTTSAQSTATTTNNELSRWQRLAGL